MESKCLLWRLLSFTNIYSQLQARFQLSTDDNQATMKFIKTKRTAVLDIYRFAPQLTASPKMSLLSKKPKMKDLYVQFMQKMLNNDQPSTPHLKMKNIVVYTRSAYTTQKPEEMQVVFDSNGKCVETFLNQKLISGPDLSNSLLGVLSAFVKSPCPRWLMCRKYFTALLCVKTT